MINHILQKYAKDLKILINRMEDYNVNKKYVKDY